MNLTTKTLVFQKSLRGKCPGVFFQLHFCSHKRESFLLVSKYPCLICGRDSWVKHFTVFLIIPLYHQ